MLVIFLAVGVMSVRSVDHTHSMHVEIGTNEVVTSEDKQKLNVYYLLFFVLSDLTPSHRLQYLMFGNQEKKVF